MGYDFIDDLLKPVNRVIRPDVEKLKEILIISGMPGETANLRYLGFNRQTVSEDDKTLEFSAVAIINNRRVSKWRLKGRFKKLSKIIFHVKWTRNPLDIFINSLRCDNRIMDVLESASATYTLLGILHVIEIRGNWFIQREFRRNRPVLSTPGLSSDDLDKVIAFEKENEIERKKTTLLPIFRQSRYKERENKNP